MKIFNLLLLKSLLLSTAFGATSVNKLENLAQSVQKSTFKNGTPTVVFDLDDTIFDTSGRNRVIFSEIRNNEELGEKFPKQIEKMRKGFISNYQYRFSDNMNSLGITNKKFIRAAKKIWSSKFFSNQYLKEDRLVYGVKDYLERMRQLGANIIYLTGRAETLRVGTLEAFLHHGIPMKKPDVLLMKPQAHMDDEEFKNEVLENLKQDESIKVLGTFENEPRNANLFQKHFPKATNFLVGNRHSGKPFTLSKKIIKVRNFNYIAPKFDRPSDSADFRDLVTDFEYYVEAAGFFSYKELYLDDEHYDAELLCEDLSKNEVVNLVRDIFEGEIVGIEGRKRAIRDFSTALKQKTYEVCEKERSIPYYDEKIIKIYSEEDVFEFTIAWEN